MPLTFRQVSGLRPFVAAEIGGLPVSLMVHSNAGFTAMVTHDVAARAGLRLAPVERPDYGIEAVGRLGGRGRTTAVTSVRVGDDVADDVEVAVFDVPQDEPVDGMLGLGWLQARGAVVDLGRGLLHTPGADAHDPALALEDTPADALAWDDDWSALVVETSVAGAPARFVVSTVAGVVVDTVAAERLGLALGEVAEQDGGPTGTVVDVRPVVADWAVDVGGRSRPVPDAVSWDVYAYAERARPAGRPVDGFLGCDLLAREGAVVDFGRRTLALRP